MNGCRKKRWDLRKAKPSRGTLPRSIRTASTAALILLFGHSSSDARDDRAEGMIDPSVWPQEWFESPKTASELGITEFDESPVLARRVARGELPPVEERLPDDPIVVQPLHGIGTYGGTALLPNTPIFLNPVENPFRIGPEGRRFFPNLASGWEWREDKRELIMHLRKGLKWSDGHELTADDLVFFYENVLQNDDLTPVKPVKWQGKRVRKIDDYTVLFESDRPQPFLFNDLAHTGESIVLPKHFLENFHADYRGKEALVQEARSYGFNTWTGYYWAAKNVRDSHVFHTPATTAYVTESITSSSWILTRNPYYPKIDPEGNQLPYIDKIIVQLNIRPEIISAKTSTGQYTASTMNLLTFDIPLFKASEKVEPIRALTWTRNLGSDVVIQPNQPIDDPKLRKTFRNADFRRALSLAINRDEINRIVYFNHATVRQNTVVPTSRHFLPEFAKAYIDYSPERARELLEGIGLVDKDGDGIRDYPDGSRFHATVEWVDLETPRGMTMELVISHWKKVGLDISIKQINKALQATRAPGNSIQIGLWHGDRTTDVLFPYQPFWFVPMRLSWEMSQWPLWARWTVTQGEEGEKPPVKIRELITWWREMNRIPDETRQIELARKILASQAENLWTIGTVGMAPHPVIVHEKLKNVPDEGYFSWDTRMTLPYFPETYYLEE